MLLLIQIIQDESSTVQVLRFAFARFAGDQDVPSHYDASGHRDIAIRQHDIFPRNARFMGRCGGTRQISQPYVPVLRCTMPANATAVWYRLFIEWPCRPQGVRAQQIGAKAVLPDPSIVGGRSPLGWFRAPARNPLWRSTGYAKMRHRCVARVNNCKTKHNLKRQAGLKGGI